MLSVRSVNAYQIQERCYLIFAFFLLADVPSGAPQMEVNAKRIEIGKKITASCSVDNTKPVTNITWQINTELVIDFFVIFNFFDFFLRRIKEKNRKTTKWWWG